MKKSTLLAAILASTISAASADSVEPLDMDISFTNPDPGVLCRSDSWKCLTRVKTLQVACRSERTDSRSQKSTLQLLGIDEARQRWGAEKTLRPGVTLLAPRWSEGTRAPRAIYIIDGDQVTACVFDGEPEFINALIEGAKK